MNNDLKHQLALARRQEWEQHWPLVASAFLGFGFYAILSNAIGLFVSPITETFGWSRTEVLAGLSISAITAIIFSPFIGALVDRFGARRIAIPGLLLNAVIIAAFGFSTGDPMHWMMLWVCQSLIVLLIKATVWTTAISNTFYAARSLALAITMSGATFTQAVAPPLAQWLIADFGWRDAFIYLGLGWGGIALLPAVFFLYDAKDRLRRSSAASSALNDTVPTVPERELSGLSLKQAFRDPSLIRIGIATLIVMVTGIGILVNQVPILVESGISREKAAYLTSLYGVAGIVGKLVTGWLMERFEPSRVGGITLAFSGFGFLLMLEQINSTALIALGLIIVGFAAGTKLQICAYLTGLYGGLKNYGKIFGVMSSMIAIGGGAGPALAALVYDLSGTYTAFIWASFVLALVAAFLILGLGPKPVEFATSTVPRK